MAERKFDYNAVSDVYNEIKRITTGSDSIKTILDNINKEYHNHVDVENEAVYGELGRQLLLDWDNTSSNFPNFVNNFENWSALIAQASGNYSEFENAIAGFKQSHALGTTSEAGRTTAYTNDGYYANSLSLDEIDFLASKAHYYELTGSTYIDTGMVSYLKTHDILEGIELALSGAAIIGGSFQIYNGVRNLMGVSSVFGSEITQAGVGAMKNVSGWKIFSTSGKFGASRAGQLLYSLTKNGAYNVATNVAARNIMFATSTGKEIFRATVPVLVNTTLNSASSVISLSNKVDLSSIDMNSVVGLSGVSVDINGSQYTYLGQGYSGVNLY
ncbi:MAG: hypothetical protein K2H20_00655, partial [Bacilli bacterium]|nr:hypothetical protein [Bacilli bacterium]